MHINFIKILSSIVDAVYPKKCIICDEILEDGADPICVDCNGKINWLDSDFFGTSLKDVAFTRAASLAAYDGAFAEAVHRFKYNGRTELAKPFGGLLASRIDYEYDLIAPVPLSRARLMMRGYNQSALLARQLFRRTGFHLEDRLLKRIRHNPPQVGLTQDERMKNVRGIFALGLNRELKGLDILLIDDVMTTGATVNECAKALKKAGAARVDVLTLARTV